jgi:pyruvate,water dikinase
MPGQVLPTPPDFPMLWKNEAEQAGFWQQDRMHFPAPVTPMMNAFIEAMYEDGFNDAAACYDLPVRAHAIRVNTYHYMTVAPLMLPPAEVEALGKRSEQKLGEAMAQLQARWESEWLPAIQRHLAYFSTFDLRRASLAELVEHLDQTLARTRDLWKLHFQIVFPAYMPISIFDDMVQDLFPSDAFGAFRLLQGLDNRTVNSGEALWKLSRKALAMPEVRKVLEDHSAAEVIPLLRMFPAGQEFMRDFEIYLQEYGQRCDSWDFSQPGWIEDPVTVIKNLKDYVGQPDRDLIAERTAQAAEREQLIAEARARLTNYPEAVRQQFEFFLHAAQIGVVLSEDHNDWIDFRATYQVRRVLMEFGRRLVQAGIIAEANDVFYLTPEELRATAVAQPMPDRQMLIAVRKAEMEHFRHITPPAAIGTLPPGPPPDNPFNRTVLVKFFGMPIEQPKEPGSIRGNAGSAGKVRGAARVIRSLKEAHRLQKGDILVAETTAPPWTPLFATAAAVVTDTGAILSHCAVVAREYGIPAVVGTGVATSLIKDGQWIEVDGDNGLVHLLD